MCNLYQQRRMTSEVASWFNARPTDANVAADIYPGYPGLVVRLDGERRLQAMTWGFPLRLASMRPTSKPKPVNNARDDKLHTPMWKASFESRRCLIPVTAWAEAEGEKGKMTCTWYSLPGVDLFAVAGIWRPTVEWGDAYSMVMVGGCEQMSEVHDRMPVPLPPEQYEQWALGSPAEAMALVRTFDGALACERSDELWAKARITPAKYCRS